MGLIACCRYRPVIFLSTLDFLVEFFLEAIKKEPGNIKPLLACSSTRLKQGKTQLAVEDLHTASELSLTLGQEEDAILIKQLADEIQKMGPRITVTPR